MSVSVCVRERVCVCMREGDCASECVCAREGESVCVRGVYLTTLWNHYINTYCI